MFETHVKCQLADAVQKLLRATHNPYFPASDIVFRLSVDGAHPIWQHAEITNEDAHNDRCRAVLRCGEDPHHHCCLLPAGHECPHVCRACGYEWPLAASAPPAIAAPPKRHWSEHSARDLMRRVMLCDDAPMLPDELANELRCVLGYLGSIRPCPDELKYPAFYAMIGAASGHQNETLDNTYIKLGWSCKAIERVRTLPDKWKYVSVPPCPPLSSKGETHLAPSATS